MRHSTPDGLEVRLEVPGRVELGQPVPIRVDVHNPTATTVVLYLRGREAAFDVTVSDERGRVLWRRLDGAVIPAIVQIRFLGPGEAMRLRDRWDQRSGRGEPVPPGRFRVRAEILTDSPEPIRTPVASLVLERR